jgi:hypothetical protein
MSDVVSCVARAATIERDVRDTCCSQASECRVWGRGEPDACTGDCHAFFVPLYTNCSYMFGQQNMVLGDGAQALDTHAPNTLDLAKLFTMCVTESTSGDQVPPFVPHYYCDPMVN